MDLECGASGYGLGDCGLRPQDCGIQGYEPTVLGFRLQLSSHFRGLWELRFVVASTAQPPMNTPNGLFVVALHIL